MDANAPRPSGTGWRALALGAAVVLLVAVVAVASRGDVPSGAVGARRPSQGLVDLAFSLFLVVLAICVVAVPIMLSFFGRYDARQGAPRRVGAVRSLLTFVVSIVLIAILIRELTDGNGDRRFPFLPDSQRGVRGDGLPEPGYQPQFAVWPVVGIALLTAVALGGWWLAARGRRSLLEPVGATAREALADVLATTLDDLRAERDPRRAVIGAYARMERALAASGLPRTETEAPEEYLERVLAEVAVSPRLAGRLTALFAWARFSRHHVRPEMKDEAIEALEALQNELAAAEAARELELAGALR